MSREVPAIARPTAEAASQAGAGVARGLAGPRRHPAVLLGGILPIDRGSLPRDVIAGATLAALAIPEVMGYTKIAGTPVITGLYTLLLPVLAFAILGSSRHLVVGADSATAAIIATGLAGLGLASGSSEYVAMASFAALMCGALLIVARLLRLGFIANFLSRSVLIGFLTGVGIQVAAGQLGGMLGIRADGSGTVPVFVNTLRAIPTETNVPSLLLSLGVIVVVVGLERVARSIPGALVAVVGAIVLSAVLDLQSAGVAVLGTVPGGLPAIGLPGDVITTANLAALLPIVVSLVVVILAQSAATSRAYAMRYDDSFDENVDLVGLGAANFAAGLSGTFVVNGSPTKTEMVASAGGRTQVAQLTTGAVVLAVLLFLTGPLAYLPNAVLAAVVFLIGLRLVDRRGLRDVLRLRPGEFAVGAITALVVIVVGVEQGIVVAMALSIVEHLSHSYRPHDSLLIREASGRWNREELSTGAQAAPGLAIYAFGASLYYANCARMTEEVVSLAEGADPQLRWLAIACVAMSDVDYSGADAISKLVGKLRGEGIDVVLCDVRPHIQRLLDAYGITQLIGPDRIYDRADDVLAAYAAA